MGGQVFGHKRVEQWSTFVSDGEDGAEEEWTIFFPDVSCDLFAFMD